MSLEEFWHGDPRLLRAYQISYIRDKSYTAWINGVYIFEANSKSLANSNRTKKSDKIEQYNDWKDPVETKTKADINRENLEKEFRTSQAMQNSWLHKVLHNQ